MATVYYGDGASNGGDGNWSTVANWFTTLGSFGVCCIPIPGNPYGKIPQPGDNVVLVGLFRTGGSNQQTLNGPSTPFNGPISWLNTSGNVNQCANAITLTGGKFSGTITIGPVYSNGVAAGTPSLMKYGIDGATCSGTVSVVGLDPTASVSGGPSIFGNYGKFGIFSGTFTGSVTRTTGNWNIISGGTYTPSPASNCALLGPPYVLSDTGLPVDPGFAVGGGTFSPVINVTGVP